MDNPLKRWRRESRLSLVKVAKVVGVSRQTIYLWERGENLPSKGNFRKLARCLNVPVAKLVSDWFRFLETDG
jgi:DNA-binding XRE family transcriptional regulator